MNPFALRRARIGAVDEVRVVLVGEARARRLVEIARGIAGDIADLQAARAGRVLDTLERRTRRDHHGQRRRRAPAARIVDASVVHDEPVASRTVIVPSAVSGPCPRRSRSPRS
jgi:hypothetical protein